MRNDSFVGGPVVLNKWMSLSICFYCQDGLITRVSAGHEKTLGSEASAASVIPSFTSSFKGCWGNLGNGSQVLSEF